MANTIKTVVRGVKVWAGDELGMQTIDVVLEIDPVGLAQRLAPEVLRNKSGKAKYIGGLVTAQRKN